MHCDVIGHRSNSVFEVDQIEEKVREGRDLRVEFTLGDHGVCVLIHAVDGVVLEDFHEADSVSVRQVVKIFEEGLLLGGIFIIVTVLLDTLTSHVLTERAGFLNSSSAEVL